ncbi:hypothetical protein TNCV_3074891 [Trichonephila clavipes]|nr:hypothetical protein TNCV_3074891 [Trichonephila clavipes]
MNKSPQSNFSLFAANNTKIPAYGMVRKELNLGLRRPFIWTFIIADVSSPIIDPSKSPWSSPLHVVPKSDSTVRPVGDYRQLNSVTEFDSYPMPYLNDFAHALHGKKIFSKIDIFKAFHQIPIAECDIPKTAVTTPWGLYEYTHLCFGLVNAPQTFMRFMHEGALRKLWTLSYSHWLSFSRKLTSSEKSYSAYDRELLAIYSAIRHFRYMLEARDFTVFTDHKPLTYAFRQKVTSVLHGRSAQPLKDITAETVAEAFFSSWVSRFGTPAILTTDRGRQFESSLFKALSKLFGVQKCRTTGYHPQANGMIEELHRPLKSAIKCHATERWTEVLLSSYLVYELLLKKIFCVPQLN